MSHLGDSSTKLSAADLLLFGLDLQIRRLRSSSFRLRHTFQVPKILCSVVRRVQDWTTGLDADYTVASLKQQPYGLHVNEMFKMSAYREDVPYVAATLFTPHLLHRYRIKRPLPVKNLASWQRLWQPVQECILRARRMIVRQVFWSCSALEASKQRHHRCQ